MNEEIMIKFLKFTLIKHNTIDKVKTKYFILFNKIFSFYFIIH